jgi:hypothetical protein
MFNPLIIRAFLTCFTIPVYLLLLITFIRYKKIHYSSAFYTLYISTGFTDILACFTRIIFDFIPNYIVGVKVYNDSELVCQYIQGGQKVTIKILFLITLRTFVVQIFCWKFMNIVAVA